LRIAQTPQNQNREAVLIRARDRSGILLPGLPGKRYKRIARFFAAEPQKMRPKKEYENPRFYSGYGRAWIDKGAAAF
jgi:hypothetical protein